MASTTSIPAETTKRCDAAKIKVGDHYSRHSFGKVTKIDNVRDQYGRVVKMMTIQNSNGDDWQINAGIMELEFTFAEQFEEEEKVSRTRLIEIMSEHPRAAMTINFNKKPKVDEVAKALQEGKTGTAKDWKALVKDQLAGAERTMIGYHVNGYDEHRRLRFNEADVGQRLVDPRTLNWAIIDRVKYTVGK